MERYIGIWHIILLLSLPFSIIRGEIFHTSLPYHQNTNHSTFFALLICWIPPKLKLVFPTQDFYTKIHIYELFEKPKT